jgi:hypothetical protein
MANGDKYEGPWENECPTGSHTVTYADGTTGQVTAVQTCDGNSFNFI